MDVFYEESAISANVARQTKYRILHVITVIFLGIAIVFSMLTVMSIPVDKNTSPDLMIFFLINAGFFWLSWFLLGRIKKGINVSFDYTFVSGELRITKVFNLHKRKSLVRIACEEMIQIGDTDNPSYERLASSPNTKTVFCTSNMEPAEGKFFMYILVGGDTKQLYVLECRELLLMHILKFTRRSVLESDYVMQEKKQKKTTV